MILSPAHVNFRHLEQMTDDTGLLEHALGPVPKRGEGYTTDDNCRALWTVSEWIHLMNQNSALNDSRTKSRLIRLADIYLAFLVWAQEPDGHFYNNFAYDRSREDEQPSDDCLGRTLWSIARAYQCLPDEERRLVTSTLFKNGFRAIHGMTHPRGQAFELSALSVLLQSAKNEAEEKPLTKFIKSEAPDEIDRIESKLIRLYDNNSEADWHWFEPMMTYGNGVLPWALFQSYQVTGNPEALRVAKSSIRFLMKKMVSPDDLIRPIGNNGWCTKDRLSQWDQQPVEVMALALAVEQAAGCLRPQEEYHHVIEKCRSWFHGENDLHVPVISDEGGCCDGLRSDGLNRNQGAESTIAYLQTELIYTRTFLPAVQVTR
ncbi:glycosyltransferase [Sporolactobacillus sp. THM7-4]|nr:glycosyltransferase [Sporolactobacillus sp. THM7-4]